MLLYMRHMQRAVDLRWIYHGAATAVNRAVVEREEMKIKSRFRLLFVDLSGIFLPERAF